MAKCAYCGEPIHETASFCSGCGKPAEKVMTPAESVMEEAKKAFEKDAGAGMDKSKITYICELCGTINRIDSPRCVRCGKLRPRSEFIAALKSIKNSENIKKAAREESKEVSEKTAEQESRSENITIQEPIAEEKKPENKLSVYRFEPEDKAAQTAPVVQPFVIVPYVDTTQKLWQYNPRQVYKFDPYTYAERLNLEQKNAELQAGAEPTLEELMKLREARQNELSVINSDIKKLNVPKDGKIIYNNKSGRIRAAAAFSLIFAAALLAAIFILPFSGAFTLKGLEVFKSIGNCLNAAFKIDISFTAADFVYKDWTSFLVPCGFILAAIFSLVVVIRSLVRLITGSAKTKGIFFALLTLIFSLVAAAGLVLNAPGGFSNIMGYIKDAEYGIHALVSLPLVLFIISIFSSKNPKNR